MTNSKTIQQQYVDLYKQLRKYIWPYRVVESIANLEEAVYKAFPNILEIRNLFRILVMDIRDTAREEEEDDFQKAIDKFQELIDSSETVYTKLDKVREVVQNEGN